MTLTDKEKKIVLIKYIIHGTSPFAETSLEIRIRMLKEAVEKCGMTYNDAEMQEIGQECITLQGMLNSKLMGYVTSNKDVVIKAHQEIHKGNESLRKELGDEVYDQGDDVLKKGYTR
tara:strand:- start:402 stop:752 length:351 start_codon:yes stop_codon:yes gene_type:complete